MYNYFSFRIFQKWFAALYLNLKRNFRVWRQGKIISHMSSDINSKPNFSVPCFYINLDCRFDRRELFETHLQRFDFLNVERINAIQFDPGYVGCTLSHLTALAHAKRAGADVTLICEDDVEFFIDASSLCLLVEEFRKSSGQVLCLGHNSFLDYPYNGSFKRTLNSQTASAYLIKRDFIITLINSFSDSLSLALSGIAESDSALDQHWKYLQTKYIFLIPDIPVAAQRPSWSDIRNSEVSYGC